MQSNDASVVLMQAGDVMTDRGIDLVLAHPGVPLLHESHVRDARGYVHLAEGVNGPIAAPGNARVVNEVRVMTRAACRDGGSS